MTRLIIPQFRDTKMEFPRVPPQSVSVVIIGRNGERGLFSILIGQSQVDTFGYNWSIPERSGEKIV